MLQCFQRRAILAGPAAILLVSALAWGQAVAPPPTRGRGAATAPATAPKAPPYLTDARKDITSLPPALLTPQTVTDLKAIQDRVEAVVKQALPATVGLLVRDGEGSGVIVSKDGYVLTAGHVSGTPGEMVTIVLSNGVMVQGRSLGANNGIDSGMVKISTPGEYPFVPMGTTSKLVAGQWVVALGHPGGYQESRPPVVRLGRILSVRGGGRGFIGTDSPLINGDSGGPLFDLDGRLIGINSRIGELVTMNIHVPIDTFEDTWDRLAKGDQWNNSVFAGGRGRGFWNGGGNQTPTAPVTPAQPKPLLAVLGVQYSVNPGGIEITRIRPGFPVEYSELREGDIVKKINGNTIKSEADLETLISKSKPGDLVTLEVLRNSQPRTVSFKLGSE